MPGVRGQACDVRHLDHRHRTLPSGQADLDDAHVLLLAAPMLILSSCTYLPRSQRKSGAMIAARTVAALAAAKARGIG
jgi:hypothetical protein